jgi:hypothetical protein
LNGTFKDNKDRARKTRQRVEHVLQEKQERQKWEAALAETEAQTTQEFAESGFTFDAD